MPWKDFLNNHNDLKNLENVRRPPESVMRYTQKRVKNIRSVCKLKFDNFFGLFLEFLNDQLSIKCSIIIHHHYQLFFILKP